MLQAEWLIIFIAQLDMVCLQPITKTWGTVNLLLMLHVFRLNFATARIALDPNLPR